MLPCYLAGSLDCLEGICYLSLQSRNILHIIITTDDHRSNFYYCKNFPSRWGFHNFLYIINLHVPPQNFSQKCINVLISDWEIFIQLISLSCSYMN